MDDSKHDDLLVHRAEVHRVREEPYQRAAYLTLDARVGHGCLEDAVKRRLDRRGKGATKPRPLVLLPVTSVE
jgi:hypothetical protein